MANKDRFDSYIEEEYGVCDECGVKVPYSDALLDERSDRLYCDQYCMVDNLTRHTSEVIEFYIERNIV